MAERGGGQIVNVASAVGRVAGRRRRDVHRLEVRRRRLQRGHPRWSSRRIGVGRLPGPADRGPHRAWPPACRRRTVREAGAARRTSPRRSRRPSGKPTPRAVGAARGPRGWPAAASVLPRPVTERIAWRSRPTCSPAVDPAARAAYEAMVRGFGSARLLAAFRRTPTRTRVRACWTPTRPSTASTRCTAARTAPGAACQGRFYDGTFTATPEAAELCRAPHLQGDPVPVTVRWSNAGGNPRVADKAPGRARDGGVVPDAGDGGDRPARADLTAVPGARPGGLPRSSPRRPRSRTCCRCSWPGTRPRCRRCWPTCGRRRSSRRTRSPRRRTTRSTPTGGSPPTGTRTWVRYVLRPLADARPTGSAERSTAAIGCGGDRGPAGARPGAVRPARDRGGRR